MILTRRYRFSASHRLHSPALSEAENQEIYGRCNNPYGHGHNYVLEVSVQGEPHRESGRVMALADIDGLVCDHVLAVYDGKNMNEDIHAFRGSVVPTTENVAADIRARLEEVWPAAGQPFGNTPAAPSLQGVRLFETPKNIFDI